MRLGALFALTLALLPLGGCGDSGQTGSPSCALPASCVCQVLSSDLTDLTVLRVQVESSEGEQLKATVVELLWHGDASGVARSDAGGPPPARAGDLIGGRLLAQKPCDGPLLNPSEEAVGSELLVGYLAGRSSGFPNCPETETDAACDEYRNRALLAGSFGFAVPWSDPLDFGQGKQLPLHDLELLRSQETCLERFPLPEIPPCNDTPTARSACSVARPLASPSAAPTFLLTFALAALLARFTRRGFR